MLQSSIDTSAVLARPSRIAPLPISIFFTRAHSLRGLHSSISIPNSTSEDIDVGPNRVRPNIGSVPALNAIRLRRTCLPQRPSKVIYL